MGAKRRAAGVSPRIAAAVRDMEALCETVRQGVPIEERFTVHTLRLDFEPRRYGPNDVRRVRELLGLSQPLFAMFLGVGAATVRSWEQGSRPPSGIARRFLEEIESDPDRWKARLVAKAAP